MFLSARQRRLFNLRELDARVVIATGPVRSGKTMPAVHGFLHWAGTNFSDQDFALGSRTMKQWNAVIEKEARVFCRKVGQRFHRVEDHYEVASAHNGVTRFWPVLGGDVSSVDKVQGMTLAGTLLDEGVVMPQEFVDEMGMRCSVEGAKIIITCNPEGPLHWLKTEYIDRADEIDAEVLWFQHADNPSLTQTYIDSLHRMYSGAVYRRKVLGEWVATSGYIYPFVGKVLREPPPEPPFRYEVAIDVASSSVTHALLFGHYSDGKSWALREWRHDGSEDGQLEHDTQVQRILRDMVGGLPVSRYIVDPAANDFQLVLQRHVRPVPVVHGHNSVMDGIQQVTRWMDEGRLFIHGSACLHLVREMANYQWDADAGMRGDDRPIKSNDHGADALRYYVHTRQIGESRAQRPTLVNRGR